MYCVTTSYMFRSAGLHSGYLKKINMKVKLLVLHTYLVYTSCDIPTLHGQLTNLRKTITKNCTWYCLAWVFLTFVHVVF